MKKITAILSLALGLGMVQAQELPTPSSKAIVKQRIGLTDIKVVYHRPNVNNRNIFGELVPFNTMWRTGANKATEVTFSTEATVQGKKLPAGTYSLFTIPGENTWVIIFNSETEHWGTGNYKQEQDVLRVEAKVSETAFTESFTIGFDKVTKESGHLCLSWATTMVCVPIQVDVAEQALKNIDIAIAEQPENWAVYRNSASYYIDNNIDNAKALTWMEKSVELKNDNWYSMYLLGKAQSLNGQHKAAVKTGENALKMYREGAEKDAPLPYESMLTNAIEEWKNTKKKKK
jgi:hypothetical protein